MSILANLNRTALEERYSYLPENMLAALNSASVKAAVDAIGKEYGFSDADNTFLEIMVGFVFMGFVHPDMVKAELPEMFELKDNEAADMAKKLNDQVFSIYRSDLEKVYSAPVPAAPKPPTPATVLGPTLNLKTAPAPLPAALPTIPTAPQSAVPVASMSKSAPSAGTVPSAITPTAAPRPFVLHKESVPEAVVSSSGFKLNLSPKITGAGNSAPVSAPPPRPAQLEIGKEVRKEVPKAFSAPTPPARVVHYTDFKSALGVSPAPAPAPAGTAPMPAPAIKQPPLSPSPINHSASWGTTPVSSPIFKAEPPAPKSAGAAAAPGTLQRPSLIKNAPGVPPPLTTEQKQVSPATPPVIAPAALSANPAPKPINPPPPTDSAVDKKNEVK